MFVVVYDATGQIHTHTAGAGFTRSGPYGRWRETEPGGRRAPSPWTSPVKGEGTRGEGAV